MFGKMHSSGLIEITQTSVQFNRSVVSDCENPWTAARQASLSITNSQSLLKLMSIGDAIQPSHPLSSPSPPAFSLSQHQSLFHWVSSSHQVAKVLEFQLFSFSPSSEYSGLPSFRIDWFDCLVSKGFSRVFSNTTVHKHQFLLYGPTLTSIHDYWKNHSFDYTDLCCGKYQISNQSIKEHV